MKNTTLMSMAGMMSLFNYSPINTLTIPKTSPTNPVRSKTKRTKGKKHISQRTRSNRRKAK